MINANEIAKNILGRRKKKLESRVINKEENKKRLEEYKRTKSKPIEFKHKKSVTNLFNVSKTNTLNFKSLAQKFKKNSIEKVSFSDFDFECEKYYEMMRSHGFHDQGQMNNYISRNKLWDDFPTIRAYNTHGSIENIKGITPHAFARVCELLGRSMSTNGRPLVNSERY